MSQVNVSINGRQYRMACEDGQEGHLVQLAKDLDTRIDQLRGPAKRARKSTKKKAIGTKKRTTKKTTAKKKAGGTRKRAGGDGRRAKKPPATAGEVVASMEAPPVGADDGNGRKDAPVAPDRA